MDPQYTIPEPAAEPGGTPSPRRSRRRWLAASTAAALLLGAVGTGVGYAIGSTERPGSSQSPSASAPPNSGFGRQNGGFGQFGGPESSPYGGTASATTTKATAAQLTGLVRIQTTLGYQGGEAAGTGMILSSTGEVVTNHHVVAGATALKVTVMSTGKSYTAKVVGTDPTADVAVIQLADASGLTPVRTDTGSVSVGDRVTNVGDANGTVRYLSAAAGKILATNQTITTQPEAATAGRRLSGLIEVSSDVISGDSGGATYDTDGEVIGMTTAASSGSSDVVGYAVPIATVLRIAGDLQNGVSGADYVYGNPAFLGIALATGADVDGAAVEGVYRNTPAARAGLAGGDIITGVDGSRIGSSAALRKAIQAHAPGDRIRLTWTGNDARSRSATITLISGPVA